MHPDKLAAAHALLVEAEAARAEIHSRLVDAYTELEGGQDALQGVWRTRRYRGSRIRANDYVITSRVRVEVAAPDFVLRPFALSSHSASTTGASALRCPRPQASHACTSTGINRLRWVYVPAAHILGLIQGPGWQQPQRIPAHALTRAFVQPVPVRVQRGSTRVAVFPLGAPLAERLAFRPPSPAPSTASTTTSTKSAHMTSGLAPRVALLVAALSRTGERACARRRASPSAAHQVSRARPGRALRCGPDGCGCGGRGRAPPLHCGAARRGRARGRGAARGAAAAQMCPLSGRGANANTLCRAVSVLDHGGRVCRALPRGTRSLPAPAARPSSTTTTARPRLRSRARSLRLCLRLGGIRSHTHRLARSRVHARLRSCSRRRSRARARASRCPTRTGCMCTVLKYAARPMARSGVT
jgi:hypothetical protein